MTDVDVKALTADLAGLAIDSSTTESKTPASSAAPAVTLTIGDAVKRERVTAERATTLVQPLITAIADARVCYFSVNLHPLRWITN
jgi:hypothetical protein